MTLWFPERHLHCWAKSPAQVRAIPETKGHLQLTQEQFTKYLAILLDSLEVNTEACITLNPEAQIPAELKVSCSVNRWVPKRIWIDRHHELYLQDLEENWLRGGRDSVQEGSGMRICRCQPTQVIGAKPLHCQTSFKRQRWEPYLEYQYQPKTQG